MARVVARLKDIADLTGYSVNTVSLALRDSPRISEEARKQIQRAADSLNYLPNQIAKSLVSQKTRTVGLILTTVTNPVLMQVAHQIEKALGQVGYGTLLASSNNNAAEEAQVIAMLRARRVDCILAFPCNHSDLTPFHRLRAAGFPVVLLVGDPAEKVDSVGMDEESGAFKAVSHLTEAGHRRIGLIDGAYRRGNLKKYNGYCRALAEQGIAFDPALVIDPGRNDVEAGIRAMEVLFREAGPITAVFGATDSLALGALYHAARTGHRVPADLAIVGFDNVEFARFAVTPLSSVNYDAGRIAELAVERAMVLVGAVDLPEPRQQLVDPDLMIRESTTGR